MNLIHYQGVNYTSAGIIGWFIKNHQNPERASECHPSIPDAANFNSSCQMTKLRASRSEKQATERTKGRREWRDEKTWQIKLIFPTVINYVLHFFLFWEKQGYLPSLPPSIWPSCRDSSFSPSSPPSSPPLCFIYSPWFTWDWWCSPLIVVIIPVLLLRCIMHNRPTKSTGVGGSKTRLPFIGLLMHAGRSLPRSSSRTADDGDTWCVKTRPSEGGGLYGRWFLVRRWCGWTPLLRVFLRRPKREPQQDSDGQQPVTRSTFG